MNSLVKRQNRMSSHKISNFFHPAIPLLLGLITSQIISTVQVYISNLDLYAALKLINDAGYLAVPNQNVMPGLPEFAPAFCGGVFFTLSIGAGISLFSLAAAWIWHHIFSRNRHWLILFLLLWAGLLLVMNLHGFYLLVTLYFLAIPPIVFGSTLMLYSRQDQLKSGRYLLIHFIPVMVLTILWFTQYDRNLFIDLRDHLLFSNPIGKKVTDFYYNYTLYAAEAFKSMDQKLLKTCRLENFSNKTLARSVEKALIKYDYLPVKADASVDLNVVKANDDLSFEHHGRAILKTTTRDLRSKPGHIFNRFSTGIDRFSTFRQFTFISLLIGYPLTLYLFFHALIWLITYLFIKNRKAAIISSILCFGISLCILGVFYFLRSPQISEHELAEALSSNRWQVRVAALRFIETSKMEIAQFKGYTQIVTSPQISERYWLAKTLANSRQAETNKILLTLTNDSNANVVSMAFWALAQRKDTRVIEKILQQIQASDDWYSQLYAYRALRSLGWNQSQSH
jgi:hypothetical protein